MLLKKNVVDEFTPFRVFQRSSHLMFYESNNSIYGVLLSHKTVVLIVAASLEIFFWLEAVFQAVLCTILFQYTIVVKVFALRGLARGSLRGFWWGIFKYIKITKVVWKLFERNGGLKSKNQTIHFSVDYIFLIVLSFSNIRCK